MSGISTVEYKGEKILYIDYQGCGFNKEKTLKIIKDGMVAHRSFPPKSALTLTNVSGLHFDMEILENFKRYEAECTPYQKKVALVGVRGLLRIGYNFVIDSVQKSIVQIFETETEAKEWLIS